MPLPASKMLDAGSWMKSLLTTSSAVYSSTPFRYVSLAFFIAAQMSLYDVDFVVFTVRSTTDTVGVGTRNDMPVSLPFTSGQTSATARAAPVLEGIKLMAALRPPFQSFLLGPSTVFCVAV